MTGPNNQPQKGTEVEEVAQETLDIGVDVATKSVEAIAPEAAPVIDAAKEVGKEVANIVDTAIQSPSAAQDEAEDEAYSYGMGF